MPLHLQWLHACNYFTTSRAIKPTMQQKCRLLTGMLNGLSGGGLFSFPFSSDVPKCCTTIHNGTVCPLFGKKHDYKFVCSWSLLQASKYHFWYLDENWTEHNLPVIISDICQPLLTLLCFSPKLHQQFALNWPILIPDKHRLRRYFDNKFCFERSRSKFHSSRAINFTESSDYLLSSLTCCD